MSFNCYHALHIDLIRERREVHASCNDILMLKGVSDHVYWIMDTMGRQTTVYWIMDTMGIMQLVETYKHVYWIMDTVGRQTTVVSLTISDEDAMGF